MNSCIFFILLFSCPFYMEKSYHTIKTLNSFLFIYAHSFSIRECFLLIYIGGSNLSETTPSFTLLVSSQSEDLPSFSLYRSIFFWILSSTFICLLILPSNSGSPLVRPQWRWTHSLLKIYHNPDSTKLIIF